MAPPQMGRRPIVGEAADVPSLSSGAAPEVAQVSHSPRSRASPSLVPGLTQPQGRSGPRFGPTPGSEQPQIHSSPRVGTDPVSDPVQVWRRDRYGSLASVTGQQMSHPPLVSRVEAAPVSDPVQVWRRDRYGALAGVTGQQVSHPPLVFWPAQQNFTAPRRNLLPRPRFGFLWERGTAELFKLSGTCRNNRKKWKTAFPRGSSAN